MNTIAAPWKAAAKATPHIIDIRAVDKALIERVFARAENIRHRHTDDSLKGRSMCWISPPKSASTRTRMSFAAAMEDLGGRCRDLPENSSMSGKEESFRDTVRVVGSYHDVIVIRSTLEQPYEAAQYSPVPVINGGNGPDQHPSQALLDGFTIKEKIGLENLTVAFVGDLFSGRAARTLALFFAAHYPKKNKFIGVSQPELRMKDDVKDALAAAGVSYQETGRIEDVIGVADVIYMTRMQKGKKHAHGYPRLTAELLQKASRHALVMHPLPRYDDIELPYEIDDFPQAVYLREQLEAGTRVRKALLQELLLRP